MNHDSQPPIRRRRPFPIARWCIRQGLRFGANWLQRHRHPFNFGIHLIGVPLMFYSLYALITEPSWDWQWLGLVLGLGLQYLGHRVEGNEMGELVAVKRLLGLSYVSVAPAVAEAAVTTERPTATPEKTTIPSPVDTSSPIRSKESV